MDARALAGIFLSTGVLTRLVLTWLIVLRTNPSLGLGWVLSGWHLYVTLVAMGLTYLIAMRWLKGRSIWITALIAGTVAVILSVPSAMSTLAGRSQAAYSLSLAFFEWFIVGLAAHTVTTLLDQVAKRTKAV